MAKVGVLFPGQLSECVGMGKAFYDACPDSRHYFERAEDLAHLPLRRLMFEGPIEELRRSEASQAAVFVVAHVVFEQYEMRGLPVGGVAGYSLGNYAALCSAGAIDFDFALSTIVRILDLSRQVVRLADGGMAAIIGIPPEELEGDCAAVRNEHGMVEIGNFNTRTQLVVTGERRALAALLARVAPRAIRAQMLDIDWPVHSSVMRPVAAMLDRLMPQVTTHGTLRAPCVPFYSQFEGQLLDGAAGVRHLLVHQVASPSRWDLAMGAMLADGFDVFVEVGPGMVLSKILRWISRDATIMNAQDPAGLDEVERQLRALGDVASAPRSGDLVVAG